MKFLADRTNGRSRPY